MPTSIYDVTDDLLELILLQLHSPVCLLSAAATCRQWRHVIAGAGFLRRFRSLHGRHVLGCYHIKYGQDIFAPAATPPEIDDRRRLSLSLDFLPYPRKSLRLTDSRGGLLAFANESKDCIVVCNPCTREHKEVRLTQIEDDKVFRSSYISAFLLDADEMDTSPLMLRFRVLYVRVHHYIHGQVYMFSARHEQWVLLSSTAARDIVSAVKGLYITNMCDSAYIYFLGRTGSSIFWGIPHVESNVLILDECTGGFSVLALPKPTGCRMLYYLRVNLRVISGDAHTVRFIRIISDGLEVLTVVRDVGTCVVDSRFVGLSQLANIEATRSRWNFLDTAPEAGPGCVVLSPDFRNLWMFSVETMMLERLSERMVSFQAFPYELPWPLTIKASRPVVS